MRHKINPEKKRKKLSLTINGDLLDIFDEYVGDKNKSKYLWIEV